MTTHLSSARVRAALLMVAALVATPALALDAPKAGAANPQEAKKFVEQVNRDLKDLFYRSGTAEWIKATYITDDTERNAAWVNEELMGYMTAAIKESMKFQGVKGLDADTERMLKLLRLSTTAPAPSDPAKRKELAEVAAKLEGMYGKGKYCKKDKAGKETCRDLVQLSKVMSDSRNYDELLDAWTGWRTVSPQMKPLYERLVALSNEGSKEIGFANAGDLWRSKYEMTPAQFEQETDRLFQQLKPLYQDLHCYVRGQLQKKYGKDKVPDGKPIPAHLLGNMWAQEWGNIYPLVQPYKTGANLDVSSVLKAQKWDWKRMVKLGEDFFVSMGFEPLPQTFWERSLFVQPKDRDVVCHASAWDVSYAGDLRIKMCIQPTEEDLITIHHELGHDFYFQQYCKLPVLYQDGANDGFHEAIGDALTLSITPGYLKQIGLLKTVPKDQKGLINVQMKDALDKVAFLPFGKLIDQWRWDVFSGKVQPNQYNQAWWALREKYQGVSAPVARTENDFDPGAKYHIPANVPYTRYFLARILQFQFHKAMCDAAGWKGPLHQCSIYGNKAAGAKLKAMLALGASKPWPEALQVMTGSKNLDAGPLIEYFQPLQEWLKEQNKGKSCGW